MSTKSERRKLHAAINNLNKYAVTKIVKQNFPNISSNQINKAAKAIISQAHELVSPKRQE